MGKILRPAAVLAAAIVFVTLACACAALPTIYIDAPGAPVKDGDICHSAFGAGAYVNMKVEISYDGGTNWEAPPVYEGTVAGAGGPLEWVVPVSYVTSTHCVLKITCDDGAGTSESALSSEFTIDNASPTWDTAPIASPSSWTNSDIIAITWAADDLPGSDDLTSEYRIDSVDDNDYTPDVSPLNIDVAALGLSQGLHTVDVRVTDAAGNQLTGSVSILIDRTPPAPFTPVANPASWTNAGSIEVTYSTTDAVSAVDHYLVGIDGAGYTVQGSPYTVNTNLLSDGSHGVNVVAVDLAGNAREDVVPIYIDRTQPSLISTFAWDHWNDTSIPVDYAAYDFPAGINKVSLWYKKGTGGAWTDSGLSSTFASDTFHFESTGDDTYYFGFVLEDKAGNTTSSNSGDGDCQTVLDTDVPEFANIAASPHYAKAGDTVTIAFTASKELSQDPYVGVDSGDAVFVGVSGLDYTYSYTVQAGDPEGAADIYIEGFDLAYNYNWTDDYTQLTIDNNAPDGFTPTADPGGWTNADSISVEFNTTDSGSGIDRYEVAVDGSGYSTQTSPYSLSTSGISDGAHVVHVRAFDKIGNVTIGNAFIYVDKTPPTEFVPVSDPGGWNNSDRTITFETTDAASGVARYEVAVDGGAYSTQSSPYTLATAGLADGQHMAHVKAVDAAGNETAEIVPVYIDRTAPLPFTPVSTPSDWSSATTAEITWGATDEASGIDHYEVALGEGAYSIQTSPYVIDISGWPVGIYTVHVRAFDRLGNWTQGDVTARITSDTTPPTMQLQFGDPHSELGRQFDYIFWKNWMGVTTAEQNTYNVSYYASDTESGVASVKVEYRPNVVSSWATLVEGSSSSGTVPFDVSGLPESDSYMFRITAVDAEGNSDSVVYDRFGLYDATKLVPTARIVSPVDKATLKMNVPFTITVQESMPVFSDPRAPGQAYRANAGDWWYAGHVLTATPKLQAYKKKINGCPLRFDKTLAAITQELAPQFATNTNNPQVAQYLGYVMYSTWQTTFTIVKKIVDTSDVFQVELKYSDVASVGNVRQPDKPNKPGQVLPRLSVEPLMNTLKQYEYSRFIVRR